MGRNAESLGSFRVEWAQWMQLAQQGDQQSYRALLTEIQPVLLGYFRRRTRIEGAAEDLSQTTLLKLHVSRHTYDPHMAFEPWLFAIARHVWIDSSVADAKRRSKQTSLEDAPEGI